MSSKRPRRQGSIKCPWCSGHPDVKGGRLLPHLDAGGVRCVGGGQPTENLPLGVPAPPAARGKAPCTRTFRRGVTGIGPDGASFTGALETTLCRDADGAPVLRERLVDIAPAPLEKP